MSRFSKNVLISSVALVVAFAVLLYFRMRLVAPTDKPEISIFDANREPELPPGEPAPIKFVAPNMSSHERQTFLSADYEILQTVSDLPAGIRGLYTVKGGPHIAMANPGEKFEATDHITDPALPRRRLIFAGVSQDRAFVHYEEGGIAHSYLVELFRLEPPQAAIGVWHGYCGPAKNLAELRRLMSAGDYN
jgi:hypothetical protein